MWGSSGCLVVLEEVLGVDMGIGDAAGCTLDVAASLDHGHSSSQRYHYHLRSPVVKM